MSFLTFQKIISYCKEQGLFVFFHSDGQIEPILKDNVSLGFDAVHPMDPNDVDLDIFEVKKKWGNQIAIFGNVDLQLLSNGNKEEVALRVKRAPQTYGARGRVMYWPMVEASLTYGKYPM